MQLRSISVSTEVMSGKTVQKKTKSRGESLLNAMLVFLSLVMLAVTISLIVYGFEYYTTPLTKRFRTDLHDRLKPGGEIGHMLGMLGSGMLLTLLLYSLRKRASWFKWGLLRNWLRFHIFLGVAGPVLITFHSSFKLRGIVAISYWSMMLVALSGVVGRYLYAQIPKAISGKKEEDNEIERQLSSVNQQLEESLPPEQLQQIQDLTKFSFTFPRSLIHAVWIMLVDDLRWLARRSRLRNLLRAIGTPDRITIFRLARERRRRLRQVVLLQASQDLFKYWHILHVPLAQTLYITMAIHILVAIKTGYF